MKQVERFLTTLFPYLLILAVALLRLAVILPSNFLPIFACVLFFGATRTRREFPVPLLALVAVDIVLTTHHYGYALSFDQSITWLFYAAVLLLGSLAVSIEDSPLRAASFSLGAAVAFFLVSNFAVWALWQMYPHTGAGLVACYVAALPFFRNSFLAEGLFGLALFALPGLIRATQSAARQRAACHE